MRQVFLGLFAVITISMSAIAQERQPNQGTPSPLRVWPDSGAWGVVLQRLDDGALGCLLLTGYSNPTSGERYFWGIRWRPDGLSVAIVDTNEQAVTGPSIRVFVDRLPLGVYQVNRTKAQSGFHSVAAELPTSDTSKLMGLMGVGGSIQFATTAFTYSAPLQGVQQAMAYFRDCRLEAAHLNEAAQGH
jgi:hypothetical protein